MSNVVFPTLAGMGIKVRTTVLAPPVFTRTTPSLREYRARDAVYPRYRRVLSYEVLRAGAEAELQSLVGFFNQRGGSFDNFLFTVPDDNAVAAQSFGVGDGTTTAFQLVRAFGGFVEPVTAVNGTPQIFKAGVLQATPANYSIGSTGIVTFTAAPTAGQALTWTGSYYVRHRFERDQLEVERFLALLYEARSVELLSDERSA